ncbi:hypothetical protein KF840_09520 [bacterium]|nr:hypothetical protein [bacterium]
MTNSASTPDLPPKLVPYAAFVIQLATGFDPAAGAVVGRVEHVLSGRAARFASVPELLDFMQGTLAAQDSR